MPDRLDIKNNVFNKRFMRKKEAPTCLKSR